jgi:uncharacterized membrane protein
MSIARALTLIAALQLGGLASAQTLRVLEAPPEGRAWCEARAISRNGRFITGDCAGDSFRLLGVHWNSARDPLTLPGIGSREFAKAVSDDGRLIVGGTNSGAMLWRPEGPTVLGPGYCEDVDATGAVVVGELLTFHGFVAFAYFTTGALIDLPPAEGDLESLAFAVDASGALAVGSTSGPSTRACLWNTTGGPPTILDSPALLACAKDISGDGRVIVGYSFDGTSNAAVRWVDGVYEEIIPAEMGAVATGVSSDGRVIVGTASHFGGAFVWDAVHGARSLQLIVPSDRLNPTVLWLERATGISDDGRKIVGTGLAADTLDSFAWEIELPADCVADFNADLTVDFFDYLDFVSAFDADDPRADLDTNGSIDFFDYLDFVAAFDAGCA